MTDDRLAAHPRPSQVTIEPHEPTIVPMATTFGPGHDLAAHCPRVPTPDGWRPWIDADGPIPDALAKRAAALAADDAVPLGTTESFPLPGVVVLIRVEPRIWTRDEKGALVEGCFKAGVVFLPAIAVPPPGAFSHPGLSQTVGVLTVVSLAVGTVATLATWGKR